jgi:hypothetical protein
LNSVDFPTFGRPTIAMIGICGWRVMGWGAVSAIGEERGYRLGRLGPIARGFA